ncbi:MAG: hypothetical protein WDZ28_01965 [Simkaniaceae bacterium]
MNLIPFVTLFLFIFSLITFGYQNHFKTTVIELTAHKGFMEADREARKKREILTFDTFKKQNKKRKKTPPSKKASRSRSRQKKGANFINPHNDFNPRLSALNLGSLLTPSEASKYLESSSLNYFQTLYQNLAEEDVLKTLFYQILLKAKKLSNKAKEKGKALSQIPFFDIEIEENQKTYFKMLKGTRRYCIEENEGYPPLDEAFLIDLRKKTLFQYGYAPAPLLQSFFGIPLFEEMIKKEKEKFDNHPKAIQIGLTKQEFGELAQNHPSKAALINELIQSIDFQNKAKKQELNELKAESKSSGIVAKKLLVRQS